MALALCHALPRDLIEQVALLFLFVSCVLQAVLVGYHAHQSGSGFIRIRGSGNTGGAVQLAAHPALYSITNVNGSPTKFCFFGSGSDTVTVSCARFVESFHAVSGLILSSFIVSVLTLLFTALGVVPLSRTTSVLLATIFGLYVIPTVLHTAAIGMFFSQSVKHAKDVAQLSVFSGSEVSFHRGFLANIAIASEAFMGAGFLAVFGRFLLSALYRSSIKQRNIKRHDIGNVMRLHLVNDDWQRQKTVLQSHARSVQLEIAIREEDAEDEAHATATVHSAPIRKNKSFSSRDQEKMEFTFRPSRAQSQIFFDEASREPIDGPHT